jgi:transglutaminase-like putative cysteine protease
MSLLEVRHSTVYRYRRPVRFGEHRAMLRPRDSHDMRILETALTISPRARVRWMHDVFSNSISMIEIEGEADTLRLESRIKVMHYPKARLEEQLEKPPVTYPFAYEADDLIDLGATHNRHYPDPDGVVESWALQFLAPDIGVLALLTTMTQRIHATMVYEAREEYGTREPAETLARQSGTCRDFALLLMEAARSLGFAARFVSGYLHDPARDSSEPAMQGAGATHAWAQIYLPHAGWIEFDPTNGIVGGKHLIRVAVARDPRQAVPVAGTFFGAPDDFLGLEVAVTVSEVGQQAP